MRNIDINELMDIASSEATTEDNSKYTLIERFFIEHSIEPSETQRVDMRLVYWMYIKWCQKNRFRYVECRIFGKETSKRFRRYNASGRKQYYINNPEQFAISQDETWKMRKFFRKKKEYAVRKKKIKEKKKQSKASGTQETV